MLGIAFRFHTPSSILVVGPSECGKTVFTEKLLLDNTDLFENPPTQVHYCYGAWQVQFQPMQDRGVMFHEGIPDHQALVQWFPQGQGVLVLDDLMDEGSNCKRVLMSCFNRFPPPGKTVCKTFHHATTRPYGYLVLDLHPASSDQQRLLSHLLQDEGWTRDQTRDGENK